MANGEFWWTILVDCVRVGVRARTEDEAFQKFVDTKFPTHTDPLAQTQGSMFRGLDGIGRRTPPKRSECSVRQALAVEVEAYEAKRTRLPLTPQGPALFDWAGANA